MQKVISVNNMRESDNATIKSGVTSIELMEKAGKSVVDSIMTSGKIGIICGTGNNAGDGFVIALELNKKQLDVTIFLIEEKFSDSGSFFFNKCKECNNIKIKNVTIDTDFDSFDYVYDCMLGTGFKGKLKQEYIDIIKKINKLNSIIISVDIPSGLNGDSGLCNPIAVKADYTISINTLKPGLFLNQAKDYCGKIINVNIGIKELKNEYSLLEKSDFNDYVNFRNNFTNKGSYGYVGILGGCRNYSGATKIANMSLCTLRSGAGVSRLIIPNSISNSVMPYLLESTLFELDSDKEGNVLFNKDQIDNALKGLKAIGIGPGWGTASDNHKILEYILNNKNLNVCIDADGLNILSQNLELLNNTNCNVCLTPHLKEMSRLTGLSIEDIESDPINISKDFAAKYNCIVVLKGPTTIITNGVLVYLSNTGNQGMATAGSGDVLTGVITGVLGYSIFDIKSISFAVFLNGLAGDIAAHKYTDIAMLSTDTINCIPDAIKELRK